MSSDPFLLGVVLVGLLAALRSPRRGGTINPPPSTPRPPPPRAQVATSKSRRDADA